MFKEYIKLTKPGIIIGNIITAIGGFFLATKGEFLPLQFLGMIIGLSFIIGSACVFNNYKDKLIDSKMTRTKNRALVKGIIFDSSALRFGYALLFLGSIFLISFTTLAAFLTALIGFFVYVFVYTPMKTRSVHGTLIGSIAGAVPPVCGYCAVSGTFDMAAFILFALIALWQMPHFYAIALYRMKEYAAASIPVLPLKRGVKNTKIQMFIYTLAFSVVSFLPTLFGYTGFLYLSVAIICSIGWLVLCVMGFSSKCHVSWAHKMFKTSLVVIMALSVMLSID